MWIESKKWTKEIKQQHSTHLLFSLVYKIISIVHSTPRNVLLNLLVFPLFAKHSLLCCEARLEFRPNFSVYIYFILYFILDLVLDFIILFVFKVKSESVIERRMSRGVGEWCERVREERKTKISYCTNIYTHTHNHSHKQHTYISQNTHTVTITHINMRILRHQKIVHLELHSI